MTLLWYCLYDLFNGFNSNLFKEAREENSSEDAERVRKRNANRNLRIALEQFRTLKAEIGRAHV